MCTITWEGGQHRLRLAGECTQDDRDDVQAALSAYGEGDVLIVDLTAVRSLAPEVAEVIAAVCDRHGRCRTNVLRRRGTQVDRVLRELGA